MPLQADQTLKFALYHQENYNGKEIKRILNKHKSIESPYNTYKYIDYHQVQCLIYQQ